MAVGIPSTNPIYPSSTEGLIFKSKAGAPMLIPGVLYSQHGATAAIASTTTETSLLNQTQLTKAFGSTSVPATGLTNGWNLPNLAGIGAMIRVKAWGTIATTATPNLTVRLTITDTAGTVSTLATTTALALVATAITSNWQLEAYISVTAYSATVGSFQTQGLFQYSQTALLTTGLAIPATSLGSIDTTSNLTFDIKQTWGASSASNTMTCNGATFEVLN